MHIPSTFTRINAAWRTFMDLDSPVDPSGYPDIRRRPAQTVNDGPGFIRAACRRWWFTPLRDRVVACEGCGGPIDPEWNCSLGSCPTCCKAGDVR